jgi:hypothetical protein
MQAARCPLAETPPQEQAGGADLADDLTDGDIRTQVVTRDRDRDAARIQSGRHVAESRSIERAPVAAMHEQRERRVTGRVGKKQIDLLARAGSVGEAEFRVFFRLHAVAISRRLALPAGKYLHMLGHARAIIVLDFVVNRHPGSSALFESDLGGSGRALQAKRRQKSSQITAFNFASIRAMWAPREGAARGRREAP